MTAAFLALLVAAGSFAQLRPPPTGEASSVSGPLAVSMRLGSVAGREDAFGFVAGAALLSSGGAAVADAMSLDLRIFSEDGALMRRVGRRGEGPGELTTIRSMRACGADRLLIYDPAGRRVSVFDGGGSFVRQVSQSMYAPGARAPYDFFCGRNGVLAFVHRSPESPPGIGSHRPSVRVTTFDLEAGIVRSLGTFPASGRYFDGHNDFPHPLGRETSVAVGSEFIYVATGDYSGSDERTFEIAVFALDGERLGSIRDTLSPREVTRAHVRGIVEDRIARTREGTRPRARRLYEGMDYPSTFPPYRRVLVDAADRVWVEEYPIPGESVRRWRIYTTEGVVVERTLMPAGLDLSDVGNGRAIGVRRGERDVQLVEVYDLMTKGRDQGGPPAADSSEMTRTLQGPLR